MRRSFAIIRVTGHRLGIVAALFSTGALVGGCPQRVTYDTPRLETRVVDAVTGQPVANASVTVWEHGDVDGKISGVSDATGWVLIQSRTRRTTAYVPWDFRPPGGRARVEAAGYAPREIDVPAGGLDTPPIELTRVR
jgi:hypothetical protein